MTEWPGFGYDLSHWNGLVDWPAIAATKPAFVILKATQGMWVDPAFDRNRRGAESEALRWLAYPWVLASDGDATVQNFLNIIGDQTIPAALDWEQAGGSASSMELWIDALPRTPLAYYGKNPPARVTPKIAKCPRWYPQYPGRADAPPALPPWNGSAEPDWSTQWLIWQWSDTGRVDGVPSDAEDLDRLACPVDVFDAWYRTAVLPGTTPAVPPVNPPLMITRILRLNSSGSDVRTLQEWLAAVGFPVVIDGDFGPKTRAAAVAFQQAHRLIVDGIVGPATVAALEAAR